MNNPRHSPEIVTPYQEVLDGVPHPPSNTISGILVKGCLGYFLVTDVTDKTRDTRYSHIGYQSSWDRGPPYPLSTLYGGISGFISSMK